MTKQTHYQLILLFVIIVSLMVGCNQTSREKKEMDKINNWVKEGSWHEGISASLHLSTNKSEFYRQYHAKPELWQKVFEFFGKTDMDTLEAGKYVIDGDQAFAMVSEYQTKEIEDARWESHRKYIDLQYVINGKEKMGVMSLKKAQGATDYNSDKDLIFYSDGEGDYYVADPETFFLFFPTDVHRPSIKVGEPTEVRKVVVKIAVAD